MVYKIVVTSEAEKDFEGFVRYLLLEKKSEQAAKNLIDDFEKTKLNLAFRYFMWVISMYLCMIL